ncbi:glycosyltransferase [Candidatus Bathyarchaeota archaeon A05DMB-2]|jgi:cellulose synthase/poly-beta-1,6-N-acetylglucosamine synthase-like glycosyltransferase|nr:glycosyltransferase [Candidatus Bathyarchaeota archaeon A05DMB-2]
MESRSVEAAEITVDADFGNLQEHSEAINISKQKLIDLLKKHGIHETSLVENPHVKKEDVIYTLRKAKVKVPEGFFKDIATELGLSFLKKTEIKKLCRKNDGCQFLTILPYRVIADYRIIPLQITDTTAKIALENPLNFRAMLVLRLLLGERKVTWIVASSESISMAIERVYQKIHTQKALLDLYYRNPDESAHQVLFPNQKILAVGTLLAAITAVIINSALTFAFLFAAVNVAYFIVNPIKIYISLRGFKESENVIRVSQQEITEAEDSELPTYTILVPVYRESKVLPQVMRNIYHMDYPKNKLDVKILMEEKDEETRNEARILGLFGKPQTQVEGIPTQEYREFLKIFEPVVIPKADITTKPRACNYGLLRAIGKYCVIYDAEDKPDQDQLKKAAVAFANAPPKTACLQSKLNFYNAKENLLTRWFSIEYSYWYDYYLSGLDKTDTPIPLGGTSNHFKIDQLRELGGWDPYNVTEDADLGVRISRRALTTKMLDSYTYEEATVTVQNWIRQRSRWYKGHVQTYLVHMRYPRKLLQDLGWKKFFLFQLTFGGAIFMPIINPFLWFIAALSIFTPWTLSALGVLEFLPIQFICLFNLFVGNTVYLLLYAITCLQKKKYGSIPYALTMPLYWVLISAAAWKGLLQLITRPFHWEKTMHGLTKNVEMKV